MFFRFILFTVLAYFIFKSLDRFLGGGKKPSANSNESSSRKKSTSKKSQTKSMIKDDVGEYVDYEEVKEEDSKK